MGLGVSPAGQRESPPSSSPGSGPSSLEACPAVPPGRPAQLFCAPDSSRTSPCFLPSGQVWPRAGQPPITFSAEQAPFVLLVLVTHRGLGRGRGASGPGHPPGLTPAGVHLQALCVLGWEGTRHWGPRPEPRVLLRRAPPPCADAKATVLVPRVPCPQVSTLRDETRRPGRGSRPALCAGRAPGPRGRPVAPTGHAGTARHARGWTGPGPAGLESGHPARVLPPSVSRALATPPPRVGHPVPGALIPQSRSEA